LASGNLAIGLAHLDGMEVPEVLASKVERMRSCEISGGECGMLSMILLIDMSMRGSYSLRRRILVINVIGVIGLKPSASDCDGSPKKSGSDRDCDALKPGEFYTPRLSYPFFRECIREKQWMHTDCLWLKLIHPVPAIEEMCSLLLNEERRQKLK
jgi:hypothetical protein